MSKEIFIYHKNFLHKYKNIFKFPPKYTNKLREYLIVHFSSETAKPYKIDFKIDYILPIKILKTPPNLGGRKGGRKQVETMLTPSLNAPTGNKPKILSQNFSKKISECPLF